MEIINDNLYMWKELEGKWRNEKLG